MNNNIIDNFRYILTNKHFYIPVIISFVLIMLIFLSKPIQNKMKTNLFVIFGAELDFWSVSHFLLYIYFGYSFPEFFLEFLIIGCIWELIEITFSKDFFMKLINGNNGAISNKITNHVKESNYWYGKVDDIFVNMSGFLVGMFLAKKRRKKSIA